MIVMYQVGIVIVLLKNRKRADKKSKDGLLTRSVAVNNEPANHIAKEIKPCPVEAKKVSVYPEPDTPILVKKPVSNRALVNRRSLDGFVVMKTEKPSPVVNKKVVIPKKTVSKPVPIRRSLSRSVDGFSIPSRSVSVSVPSRSVKLV